MISDVIYASKGSMYIEVGVDVGDEKDALMEDAAITSPLVMYRHISSAMNDVLFWARCAGRSINLSRIRDRKNTQEFTLLPALKKRNQTQFKQVRP